MASELRVNTLKDASGNNSIATSFVAGGSAKAWIKFTNKNSNVIHVSFNISSFDDDGTGDFGINFTNSMSSAEYSAPSSGGEDNRSTITNFGTVSSSAMDGQTRQTSTNNINDAERISIEILGDLA
jgi:hypothetical protein